MGTSVSITWTLLQLKCETHWLFNLAKSKVRSQHREQVDLVADRLSGFSVSALNTIVRQKKASELYNHLDLAPVVARYHEFDGQFVLFMYGVKGPPLV